MKRRNSGGESVVGAREEREAGRRPDANTGLGSISDWAEAWGEGEQERVARWLTSKGRATVATSTGPLVERPGSDPWEVDDRPALWAAAPATSAAAAADPVDIDQLHARSALEAEVAYLEDERRRLAVALEHERAECEQVRTELALAASMLHDNIADLEEQRRHALSSVEAGVAAAERARADEQAARAALEATRSEAKALEARHFEVWIALDDEVSALAARRRRLRALQRRRLANGS